MSTVGRAGRSFKRITKADLRRLAAIAEADRRDFFARYPDWSKLYARRHFATALCQGAAQHFVDGKVGVQDFDVYTFYTPNPARRWYAKRNQPRDFGSPKFGCSPDRPEYVGRRVDLLGRAIARGRGEDPAEAIGRWLSNGRTKSARFLAQKAVVLLAPRERLGEIVWRPQDSG